MPVGQFVLSRVCTTPHRDSVSTVNFTPARHGVRQVYVVYAWCRRVSPYHPSSSAETWLISSMISQRKCLPFFLFSAPVWFLPNATLHVRCSVSPPSMSATTACSAAISNCTPCTHPNFSKSCLRESDTNDFPVPGPPVTSRHLGVARCRPLIRSLYSAFICFSTISITFSWFSLQVNPLRHLRMVVLNALFEMVTVARKKVSSATTSGSSFSASSLVCRIASLTLDE